MVQKQSGTRLLKIREVLSRRALASTSHYRDIKNGLFTRPIKATVKTSAWPESEVETLIRARIAGKPDDEIRVIVDKLHAARIKG
jgi:prophage regulatory protein